MTITSSPITQITSEKVAGAIGAEIGGVRLSGDLDDATVAAIRALIIEHKVVFFREQHLDEAGQVAFASRLGSLTQAHPTVPSLDGHGAILDLDAGETGRAANNWHTDVTFVEQPPSFSVLRGVTIPPYGGDTLWANTAAAYQALPEGVQRLVEGLWGIHSNAYDYVVDGSRNRNGSRTDDDVKAYAEVFSAVTFETRHPLVRVHPESGERALLAGGFLRRIEGFNASDSAALLAVLHSHVTRPEHTVRWHWHEGDIVIWDNRATQHYAIADFGTQKRVVRRVTVNGEVPVSVDGQRSERLGADASAYYAGASATN